MLVAGTDSTTAAFTGGEKYTVTVADAVAKGSKEFEVATDVSVPQVSKVEAIGNKVVRVFFSEPVIVPADETGKFDFELVTGQTSTPLTTGNVTVEQSADLLSATITFNSELANGTHTLKTIKDGAKKIADFAGYEVPVTAKEFTVTTTTTVAQVADVTVNNRTEVTVQFDSPVVTPAATTLYWNTNGSESSASNTATSVKRVNDTTYTYTFSGTKVLPVGKVTFFVKGATDVYGNAVPTKKFEKSVVEEAKLTATLAAKNDDQLVVTYSKAADKTTAETVSNYKLVDKDGKEVSITGATYNADKKTVTLVVTDLKGDYKLTIKDVKDAVGVKIDETTLDVNVKDTTAPNLALVTTNTNGTNKFTLTFPEAMATTGANSISNVANYLIALDGTNYDVLPTGTTAVASADGKTVTFTLPAGKSLTGTSKITIGHIDGTTLYTVADAAGNAGTPATGTAVTIAAASAPSISAQALKIVDAKTLELAYAGAALSTLEANDFVITLDGGNTTFPAATAEIVDGKIKLTLPEDKTISSKTLISGVEVSTEATAADINSKTALGGKLTHNETSANPTTSPFAASLKEAVVVDAANKKVRVTLDGLVGVDLSVATGLGKILVASQADEAAITLSNPVKIDDSTVEYELSTLNPAKDVTIKTIGADFITQTDANGVKYKANTTGVVASATGALIATDVTATIADTNTNVIAIGDKVEITFNRLVDTTSIKADWKGDSKAATIKISATGELTVDGYNFGKVSGLSTTAATSFAGTIEFNETSNKLIITATAAPTNATVYANSKLVYTGVNTVKSPSGLTLTTAAKPETSAFDAKPFIIAAKLTKDAATADVAFGAVGDELTITFSEAIKLTLTDTDADADGYFEMTDTEFTNATGLTGTGGVFKAKAVGKDLVIEVTTTLTPALAANNTVSVAGNTTGVITDGTNNQVTTPVTVNIVK